EGAGGALLVVADAGVDQDIVGRRLHQVALDAQHQLIVRIEGTRLQPGAVLAEQLLGQLGEELESLEEWPPLLDDAVDRDVAHVNAGRHDRRSSPGDTRWQCPPASRGEPSHCGWMVAEPILKLGHVATALFATPVRPTSNATEEIACAPG